MFVARRMTLAAVAVATLALAACGGDDAGEPAQTPVVQKPTESSPSTQTQTQPARTNTTGTSTTQTATTETQTTPTQTQTTGASAQVAQGKEIFASAGCSGCHTLADANANGTVGPNLDDLKPGEAVVAKQVTNGGGVMPAFKGRLSTAEIQAVATYVSSVAGK